MAQKVIKIYPEWNVNDKNITDTQKELIKIKIYPEWNVNKQRR